MDCRKGRKSHLRLSAHRKSKSKAMKKLFKNKKGDVSTVPTTFECGSQDLFLQECNENDMNYLNQRHEVDDAIKIYSSENSVAHTPPQEYAHIESDSDDSFTVKLVTVQAQVHSEPEPKKQHKLSLLPGTQTPEFGGIIDSESMPLNFSGNSTPSTLSENTSLELEYSNEIVADEVGEISGRRIFDIQYFFDQIMSIDHGVFNCAFKDLVFLKEIRSGFQSSFVFKCKMCNKIETFLNERITSDINKKVVQAVVCSGSSFSQLDEMCAHLNMPCMTDKTFIKENMLLGEIIKDVALKSMYEAGVAEKKIAIEKGNVDSDGLPFITVVADASWGKRSYRTSNYNSLSGVACIMGYETKKVLFLGVRNSYCCICAVAKNRNVQPQKHKCFKNWSGTSTAMEADGVVEGFKSSIAMHGLKFTSLIGDGDSSVMSALNEALPYGHTTFIKKIECSNHLLRNYCTKLRNIAKKTENKHGSVPVILRKCLGSNILRLRKAIKGAVDYTSKLNISFNEKVNHLKEDILNGPCHVFGDHDNCKQYYCKGAKVGEENLVDRMKGCGLWYDIYSSLTPITNNVESLLMGQTNNIVEQFNALIAKFIGGKRINYSLRNSYESRCYAAATKKNVGSLIKSLHDASETTDELGSFSMKYDNRIQRIAARKRKASSKRVTKKSRIAGPDEYYGDLEKEEDISPEEFEIRKNKMLEELEKSANESSEIEKNTIGQSSNPEWVRQRKLRITASMFGQVCKMRPSTSCKNIVKTFLYSTFKGSDATRYGAQNEPIAVKDFENLLGVTIIPCGLFIDKKLPFLGASPDGLIGENSLLEIKCPALAANMTPAEAIEMKKINFCTMDQNDSSKIILKRNHNYYYQVQGQLNITKRKYCYFVVWSPSGILYEKIEKDVTFWENIINKLKDFYFECLLPEIIDPRLPRKLAIRERISK